MKNYAMYYSYKGIGDVLIIIFNNSLKMTRSEKINNVVVIYHDEEIIGYNIFDIKEIVKIKNEGMIYFPSETFLEIVNSILINAHQEPLEKKESSGYVVAEVVDAIELDEHKLFVTLSTEQEMINTIVKDAKVEIGDKVVVALVDTFLNSGEVVKSGNMDGTLLNGHICTAYELGIKDKEDAILTLNKDERNGEDFFMVEA